MSVRPRDVLPLPTPTIATDGDISVEYMQRLTNYLQDDGDTANRFRNAASPEQILNIFTDAMQELKSVWAGVLGFFSTAVQAVTDYQATKDGFLDLWQSAKDIWDRFINGRDLDEPLEDGRQRTSVIVRLRDGQQTIEAFRVGNLKSTINDVKAKIEDEINTIKNRARDLAAGAAAYAGRPSGGGLASAGAALNELELAGSQAREIMEDCLQVIELFDLISDIEDNMEQYILTQGNPQTTVTETVSTRKPQKG